MVPSPSCKEPFPSMPVHRAITSCFSKRSALPISFSGTHAFSLRLRSPKFSTKRLASLYADPNNFQVRVSWVAKGASKVLVKTDLKVVSDDMFGEDRLVEGDGRLGREHSYTKMDTEDSISENADDTDETKDIPEDGDFEGDMNDERNDAKEERNRQNDLNGRSPDKGSNNIDSLDSNNIPDKTTNTNASQDDNNIAHPGSNNNAIQDSNSIDQPGSNNNAHQDSNSIENTESNSIAHSASDNTANPESNSIAHSGSNNTANPESKSIADQTSNNIENQNSNNIAHQPINNNANQVSNTIAHPHSNPFNDANVDSNNNDDNEKPVDADWMWLHFPHVEVVAIKPDTKEADVQADSVTFAMDYRNELVGLAMELDFFQSRRVRSE